MSSARDRAIAALEHVILNTDDDMSYADSRDRALSVFVDAMIAAVIDRLEEDDQWRRNHND